MITSIAMNAIKFSGNKENSKGLLSQLRTFYVEPPQLYNRTPVTSTPSFGNGPGRSAMLGSRFRVLA
jgi:hypothetical protein